MNVGSAMIQQGELCSELRSLLRRGRSAVVAALSEAPLYELLESG